MRVKVFVTYEREFEMKIPDELAPTWDAEFGVIPTFPDREKFETLIARAADEIGMVPPGCEWAATEA